MREAIQGRVGKSKRCAIYTRKSSEEGLDQAFNSLDAQREACAAYVLSQKHEGWTAATTLYDDGGYSGGTMERPALKRLIADIESGRIDVIVVYKVDRLTRALSDFAKLVEVFDRRGVSFVSITLTPADRSRHRSNAGREAQKPSIPVNIAVKRIGRHRPLRLAIIALISSREGISTPTLRRPF